MSSHRKDYNAKEPLSSHLSITRTRFYSVHIATVLGNLDYAVLLQQIRYWIEHKKEIEKDFHDNHYWVYNTYDGWKAQFPFWSVSKIRRLFNGLEDLGIVLSGNYNQKNFDNTKWYTIDFHALDRLGELGLKAYVAEREAHLTNPTDPSVQNEQTPSVQNEQTSAQNEQTNTKGLSPKDYHQRISTCTPAANAIHAPSKHLEKISTAEGTGGSESAKNDLGELIDAVAEKTRQKRNEKASAKSKQPRKPPQQNTNTAVAYFRAQFEEHRGAHAPDTTMKERGQLKKLIELYGYSTVIAMMDWMFRNWAEACREKHVVEVQNIGFMARHRDYLHGKVITDATVDATEETWWG